MFQTSDFALAITLISLGFKIYHIDRNDSSRVQFCFEREKGLDQAVTAFWTDEIRIEPKVLLLNHKLLKSRLYSAE